MLEEVGRIGADLADLPRAPDGWRDRLDEVSAAVVEAMPAMDWVSASTLCEAISFPADQVTTALAGLVEAARLHRDADRYRLAAGARTTPTSLLALRSGDPRELDVFARDTPAETTKTSSSRRALGWGSEVRMVVRIGVEQRRARLASRHRLAASARVDSTLEAASSVVCLHASDPASVYLAAIARLRQPDPAEIERTLYEERTVVRMLGMRRTLFVVPLDLMPAVQEAAASAVGAQQRKLLVKMLETAGHEGDVKSWLAELEEAAFEALRTRGPSTAAEISAEVPLLRTPIVMAAGKPYESTQNITGRVLIVLAAHGRIVRGRPRGSWMSRLYQWSVAQDWLPAEPAQSSAEEGAAELARRWLSAFGPAPLSDLKWWTGWSLGQTKKALSQLNVSEVDLDGTPGIALADDLKPAPAVRPWAALLPGLDPTPMGWQDRGWFLGEHAAALFDRNGNIGPTVWLDGRIVGGWAQRASGEIVYRLLEDVDADATTRVQVEVERLTTVLGDRRVTPSFRTPLEKELSA
ncbi:winged helix DNA-binding domain-containing protein [Fodinicola feengrottensis]|nr:winged helix DNA-binding domain-containing protein [Fodinicola feengrottensis]